MASVSLEETLRSANDAVAKKDWTEAEVLSRRALRERPIDAAALCLLAAVHSDRGDDVEALRLYQSAVFCDPNFLEPYHHLAQAYYSSNRLDDAVDLYRRWAQVEPENPQVQHLMAATTGQAVPARCSDAYVKALFNPFARTFDDVLLKNLAYRGPDIVAASLAKHSGDCREDLDVLDLGCGSGLCGRAVRSMCRRIVGIDLAEKMVELARRRGCYDALDVAEVCAFMEGTSETFDAVISADVLIYFGELDGLFRAAHRVLRPDGLLIVTVEALKGYENEPYRLMASGRYAHQERYLREVLRSVGFSIVSLSEEPLRWEQHAMVSAYATVARKS